MHFAKTNSPNVGEYSSTTDNTDLNLDSNPYWIQTSISETLFISDRKPEINRIESVKAKAKAIRQKIICTPKSEECNLDGKSLTGRILVIEVEIDQLVYYIANLPEQTIHTERVISNFAIPIVVSQSIKDIDSLNINFQINICIEDISIAKVCGRELLESIVLLVQAVPISSS